MIVDIVLALDVPCASFTRSIKLMRVSISARVMSRLVNEKDFGFWVLLATFMRGVSFSRSNETEREAGIDIDYTCLLIVSTIFRVLPFANLYAVVVLLLKC